MRMTQPHPPRLAEKKGYQSLSHHAFKTRYVHRAIRVGGKQRDICRQCPKLPLGDDSQLCAEFVLKIEDDRGAQSVSQHRWAAVGMRVLGFVIPIETPPGEQNVCILATPHLHLIGGLINPV